MKPRQSTILEGLTIVIVMVLLGVLAWFFEIDRFFMLLGVVMIGLWIVFRSLLAHIRLLNRNMLREQRMYTEKAMKHQESFVALNAVMKPKFPLPLLRDWTISPEFANILLNTIGSHKPKVIVECGSGASTLIMSYALGENTGSVIHSLEHDEKYFQSTREMLQLHEKTGLATVYFAQLVTIQLAGDTWQWYDPSVLEGISDIDLLIVDGPPGRLSNMSRYPALPILKDKLSPTAIILIDDYDRADEKRIVQKWSEEHGFTEIRVYDAEHGVCELRRPAPNRHPQHGERLM